MRRAEWKADLTQRLALAHIELDWSLAYDEDLLLRWCSGRR